MAPLTHVSPGDLMTSELLNAIIDALNGLDAKITKCCAEIDKQPDEPKEREDVVIRFIEPNDAFFDQLVDIVGGGFIPDEAENYVDIGGERVKRFGKVTRSLIQAVVPALDLREKDKVEVLVKNRNGFATGMMIVGPKGRQPDVVFVPSPPEVVDAMLSLAKVDKRETFFDLGSGDGRLVIKAVQDPHNAQSAVGIDIDPERIKEANAMAEKAGAVVMKKVKFIEGDLFTTNLSQATVIALHLLPKLNLKLRPKLEALKPGTRIVSHAFDMGDWKPDQQMKVTVGGKDHDVFLWTVPK